jgi:hypothetical protein
VENINGGAKIIYTRPSDNDLLGVKAVYTLHEGEEAMEVFSSAFTDTIILEGYGDTQEYTVELFAVDKSYNLSKGVTASIRPLTAPIHLIRETLEPIESFGGVHAFWQNELGKDIVVSLYTIDENGDYVVHENYFTKEKEGSHRFTGMEAGEQQIRISMRDRWGNAARNLDTILAPMLRENVFGRELASGAYVYHWKQYGYDLCNPWNGTDDWSYKHRGDLGPATSCSAGFWVTFNDYLFGDGTSVYWQINPTWTHYTGDTDVDLTAHPNMPWPFYFTIDMGRKASYSDMRYWMRNRSSLGTIFSARAMTVFDIWATNNPRPVNASDDKKTNLQYWTSWEAVGGTDAWKSDWVKIASCNLVLPSGITKSSQTNLTDADKQFVQAGFAFDMDPRIGNQSFRYLRFEVKETNSGAGLDICEFRFWGSIDPNQ